MHGLLLTTLVRLVAFLHLINYPSLINIIVTYRIRNCEATKRLAADDATQAKNEDIYRVWLPYRSVNIRS